MDITPCCFPIFYRSLRLLALLAIFILLGALTPAQVRADANPPTHTCTPSVTPEPSATPEPTTTPLPTNTPGPAEPNAAAPKSNDPTASSPPKTATPSSVVSQAFTGKNAGLNQCLVGLIFVASVIVIGVIAFGLYQRIQGE